jgi:UDP-N-acetylmuramoyl-L-alanyl-D-glutamate--2,6-diaminopimelate ligase
MTLAELLGSAGVRADAVHYNAEITGICSDSRRCKAGDLFVCMPSTNSDSHSFIASAAENGASAALVHSEDGLLQALRAKIPAVLIRHEGHRLNEALCALCNVFFGYPTRHMKVVGVTGTNGKTTTAWLIRDMLRELGLRSGYLGTLGFQLPGEERELSNTTPFPVELYTMLAEARNKGVEALAMEVSSHALEERRCEYVEFDVGVFTNLTQDHLDFHGSMEAYEAAKLRLFTDLPKQSKKAFRAVINVDDQVGRKFSAAAGFEAPDSVFEFGLHGRGLSAEIHEIAVDHLAMRFASSDGAPSPSHVVRIPLGGSYNVENTLSATGAVLALGYGLEAVERVLPHVRPVPGRFEAVPNDEGIGILVDYAHTPDALEKLLDAVRPLTQGLVITVFGCGGDRDRTKRPLMARAASERSDLTIVTSDNPRTEDPQKIIEDILPGILAGKERLTIADRGEAIARAVQMAKRGDVVVIAGKGHENYQIIGRTKYPMDDRELAREGLRRRSMAVKP